MKTKKKRYYARLSSFGRLLRLLLLGVFERVCLFVCVRLRSMMSTRQKWGEKSRCFFLPLFFSHKIRPVLKLPKYETLY